MPRLRFEPCWIDWPKSNVVSDDVDEAMTRIGLAIGDMTAEAENEYLEELDLIEPV